MILNLTLINIIYLVAVIIGLIVGLVTLTYGVKKGKSNALLGSSFIFLSLGVFLVFLIDTKLMSHFPSWYRTGNLFGLIFVPLPYLYFKYTLFPKKFHTWEFLHFLPACLYFLDFTPIYFLPSAEKIEMINTEIMDPSVFVEFSQSRFFPSSFYTPFRVLLQNIYWFASVFVFWRFVKKSEFKANQKHLKKWIVGYLVLLSFLFFPFYFSIFTTDSTIIFRLIHFSAAILLLSSAVYLLFFPSILYGILDKVMESKNSGKRKATRKETLNSERVQEIEIAIKKIIEEDRVHLIQGYTAQDLARDSGIPYYVLTSYLNQNLGTKFTDFINKKRIEHALELIDSKNSSNYTLEAIGHLSGFTNRNSFSSAFKKMTGEMPSSYISSKTGAD